MKKLLPALLAILLLPAVALAELSLEVPYAKAAIIQFALWETDGTDLKTDASFASGDCKYILDQGTETNCTNLPTDEGQTYSLSLTAAELTGTTITINIVDSATKTWLDKSIQVTTFLTGPTGTAQAGAAGSITLATSASTTADLYNGQKIAIINGTGAGQTRQISDYSAARVATVTSNWTTTPDSTSEYILQSDTVGAGSDVNVTQWNGTSVASPHTAGYPICTIKDGTGTGEIDTASGEVTATGVGAGGGSMRKW